METKWDPDPRISKEIELKRKELQILFSNKVEHWLAKYSKKSQKRDYLINARLVLLDKVKKLTMPMLEPLERMLHKNFGTKEQVDLCSDDDEVQVVSVECGPFGDKGLRQTRHANFADMSPEIIIDDSEDEVQMQDSPSAVKNAPALCFEVITPPVNVPEIPAQTLEVPLPESEVLHLESLDLSVPETTAQSTSSATKQRRKSVNSRPSSSKDLPSIADYKIKTPNLQPPSIYAKSAEKVPKVRNIISVPYKNPVRQTNNSAAYDPQKDSQRLEYIKEKIYANNYLKLDMAHKIEMQKKLEEEEHRAEEQAGEKSSDTSEEEEEVPQAKRLQKSKGKLGCKRKLAEKSNAQPPRKRGRPRKQEPKSFPPQSHQKSSRKDAFEKKKAVPVSKRVAKKKKQKFSFDTTDDEDYVVPSHVLDPIDTELDALQNGTFKESRWAGPSNSIERSLNATTATATPNLEDDLIQILSSKLPVPIDSKKEEADTRAIVEQSFDEDNLLVEIEVDKKKDKKPRRTHYFAPKNRMRSASAMSQRRGRGRPRKAAGNRVQIKEEPTASD